MKRSNAPLSSGLSRVLNITWYSGIAISSVLFLLVCSFLVVTFGDFNVNVPPITYESGSYTYRFNNKYLHIIKNDELVKEHLRKEMNLFTGRNDTLGATAFFNNLYKSLYGVARLKSPQRMKQAGNHEYYSDLMFADSTSFLNVSEERPESLPLMTTSYSEIKYAPQFVISLSILVLSYAFFGLMIIFNARKILLAVKADNLFSRNNSESIKFIGLYILLSEVVRVMLVYWMNSSTIKGIKYFVSWAVGPLSRSYTFSFSDINYWTLFIGFMVVILSEVFRSGARLKEDVDLTI
ncbi:MAG TPA: DUF2975 domain-containing protein [Ignavibacteriales bacterium]|nr:DUF2975 domain-containing protein [Ignavibacteriales bacterium]